MDREINASDYYGVHQVLARYCRGIDRMDRALLEKSYWEDGFDDHVLFSGKPAAFIDWVLEYLAKDKSSLHMLGQSFILFNADNASGETYFSAQHIRSDETGDFIGYSSGRYIDVFQKRAGEWRIWKRTVVLDIRHRKPLGEHGSFDGFPVANVGRRGSEDTSYKVF